MKFNLNKKGFSFSPYLMIVMMLLGIIMAFHFIIVDSEKSAAIAQEGSTLKNALQVEGTKSAARNAILLSAYDAIDAAINPRGTEARGKTAEDLELKKYLEAKILSDLNGAWSVKQSAGAVGTYDSVTINELDGKGKIRTDGFLVSAEGEYVDGIPMKLEKYVDSGVFSYYDKIMKDLKEKFLESLKTKFECKIYGVSCKYHLGMKGNELLDKSSIKCTAHGYSEDSWKIKNDIAAPEDALKDASAVRQRIEEALKELVLEQIKKKDHSASGSAEDLVTGFNITYIEANVELTNGGPDERTEETGQCCLLICGEKENKCKDDRYDVDYWTTLHIYGKIYVQELYAIGDATMKEEGEGYEVCIKNPIMTKDGAVKPLKKEVRGFELTYDISIDYLDNCDPGKAINKRDVKEYSPAFPEMHINGDSLVFNNEPVKCEWGPMDNAYKETCGRTKYVGGKECICGGQGTHCRNNGQECCGSNDY